MYLCIYIYIYTCLHTHTHDDASSLVYRPTKTQTITCARTQKCKNAHASTRKHTYTCLLVHIAVYSPNDFCIHIYIYIYIYIYMYIYIYICIYWIYVIYIRHVILGSPAANNDSHTYEWVMPHIWMNRITHMKESWHTCHTWLLMTNHPWQPSYQQWHSMIVTHPNESCLPIWSIITYAFNNDSHMTHIQSCAHLYTYIQLHMNICIYIYIYICIYIHIFIIYLSNNGSHTWPMTHPTMKNPHMNESCLPIWSVIVHSFSMYSSNNDSHMTHPTMTITHDPWVVRQWQSHMIHESCLPIWSVIILSFIMYSSNNDSHMTHPTMTVTHDPWVVKQWQSHMIHEPCLIIWSVVTHSFIVYSSKNDSPMTHPMRVTHDSWQWQSHMTHKSSNVDSSTFEWVMSPYMISHRTLIHHRLIQQWQSHDSSDNDSHTWLMSHVSLYDQSSYIHSFIIYSSNNDSHAWLMSCRTIILTHMN